MPIVIKNTIAHFFCIALAAILCSGCFGSKETTLSIYDFRCPGKIKLTELAPKKQIYKMRVHVKPAINGGEVIMKFSDSDRIYTHSVRFRDTTAVTESFDWYSTDGYILYEPLGDNMQGEATIFLRLYY